MDQNEQLHAFVATRSEEAFRVMVSTHLPMVYATARRMLHGNATLAEDVAQQVFIDLARKASSLPRGLVLGGWLYRHTTFVARKTIRSESRRRKREQTAATLAATMDEREDHRTQAEDKLWPQLAPFIDEAMESLHIDDRTAIVLRFLEEQSLRSVGDALGISEGAASKRVSRALEKLRGILARRGIFASASGLAMGLRADAARAELPQQLTHTVTAKATSDSQAVSSGLLASVSAHFLSAALGAAIVFFGDAIVMKPKGDETSTSHSLNPGHANEALGALAADSKGKPSTDSGTLSSIVEEIREVAGLPETRRRTAELEALLAKVPLDQLEAVAIDLSGNENTRLVWFRVAPILFKRWCRFETEAALEFYANSPAPEGWWSVWHGMLRRLDAAQGAKAREWFLRRVVAGDIVWKESTGAEIALKSPHGFEAFLKALPGIPGKLPFGERTTLAEAIRARVLDELRSRDTSLEIRRDWAETLTDPQEIAGVLKSMFYTAAREQRESGGRTDNVALLNTADWAWDHFPEGQREESAPDIARTLTEDDAQAAIQWFKGKATNDQMQNLAMRMLRYPDSPRPRDFQELRPQARLAWAETLSDPGFREDAAAGIFRRWCRSKQTDQSPRDYLSGVDLSPERRARFQAILANP